MPLESSRRPTTANYGPHPAVRSRRRLGAVALVGAGLVALGTVAPLAPALAQRSDAVQAPMARAPLTFADIVEKVKPSVVSISVTNGGSRTLANRRGGGGGGQPFGGVPGLPDDHPLNEFFKNLPEQFRNQQPRARPSLAQGSGFVISADGYVVTNNHVVDGASKIEVSFDDQEKLEAELIGADARTDLALIKIKGDKTFPYVRFASKSSRVGDWVLAVGNPFGLGGTVTAGILSASSRDIGSGPYDFIQVDAAVNRGNSGGPTFNLDGEVIGVNTAIFSPSGGNVGIAFAVPAKTAATVVEQLKSKGSVERGWLGVRIQNVDEDMAASLGLQQPRGALVVEATPNGPAEKSGILVRDAILKVNGAVIEDSRDLARKIAEYAPDTTVDVLVWRNNAEKMVPVRLGLFPKSGEELARLQESKPAKPETTELGQLGLTLAPADDKADSEGVAIAEVDNSSDAAIKGLKAGDRIVEIGGEKVVGADDVRKGVKKARDLGRRAVLLQVMSGERKRYVAVQLMDEKPDKG